MKKSIAIILALVSVALITSCKSREQRELEQAISQDITIRSVSYFGEADSIKLYQEVDNQIMRQEFYLNWHSSFAEAFAEASQDTTQPMEKRLSWKAKAEKYKDAVKEDRKNIAHLDSVRFKYSDTVSFKIYEMHYLYLKDDGTRDLDICYGKFDMNKNLVAYKYSKNPKWIVIGDDCSIPNYELNPDLVR